MEGLEKLCNEKHHNIDERFQRDEKWIGEHETKIDELQRSDATNTNQIKNLTKSLGSLTKALWGLAGSILLMLISSIIDKL